MRDPASRSHTIALFAPSGCELDAARTAHARDHFAARGHRVVDLVGPSARHQRFAADDAERLAVLRRIVDDASIEVAMALRGGYGLTRLLPSIDFDAMAAAIQSRGLQLVGHSDFTALQLALLAATGATTLAGPMASYDFGAAPDPFTETGFWSALAGRVDVAFATPHDALDVEGLLWGGNLAMLCSLVGTPWLPAVDGGVLFVEDVNEHPYRIERMLLQLADAGILARQRAVLVGDFSGWRASPHDGGYDVASAIGYVAARTGVPFVTGLPFGHCARKATLIVGAPARVVVEGGRCALTQRLAPTPAQAGAQFRSD